MSLNLRKGDIITLDDSFGSYVPLVYAELGVTSVNGCRALVVEPNDRSDMQPLGINLEVNGEFIPNTDDTHDCYWVEFYNIDEVYYVNPTVMYNADKRQFYIEFGNGFYVNGDLEIVNEPYYFSNATAEKVVKYYNMNLKYKGTPKIVDSRYESYSHYISMPAGGYLHSNGVIRLLARDDNTKAWYKSFENAQEAIDTYHKKFNIIGEIPVEDNYYLTFTKEHLSSFNVYKPEKVLIKIRGFSKSEVIRKYNEAFGYSNDVKMYHNVYKGDDTARKIINEMYQGVYPTSRGIYTTNEVLAYKYPDTPENYTKKLVIHKEFADTLMKLNLDFNLVLNNATFRGNNGNHVVKATNSFNTTLEKGKRVEQEGSKIKVYKQDLRLGRVIKAFAGHLFTDLDIEGIVSEFKTKYEIDTSVVQVSDKVGRIYGISSVGGSCMAGSPSETFDIYEDMGSRIAYITDNSGYLRARALIHDVVDVDGNEYTILDRIFYEDEKSKLTMQQWRREQKDMTRLSYHTDKSFRGVNPVNSNYEVVPYVDNLCYAIKFDDDYYLANSSSPMGWQSYDHLQETNGSSDSGNIAQGNGERVYCEDTENHIHIDDAYYCDGDDCYYQYDDDLEYIDGAGYYHTEDSRIAYDEHAGEYRWRDDLKYCESEWIYTSSDDYVEVVDGNNEGSYEPIDDVTYCEDVDGYVMNDNATYITDNEHYVYDTDDYFEHDNGQWYSYEEEDEDDSEDVA